MNDKAFILLRAELADRKVGFSICPGCGQELRLLCHRHPADKAKTPCPRKFSRKVTGQAVTVKRVAGDGLFPGG